MPLTLTRDQIATAMGVNVDTVTRRLKGVPRSRDGSTYLLAAVLPRAKPDHLPALFAAATDDSALFVGSGPVTMAIASILDASLTPEARHRYQRVRAAMVSGLTYSRGGAAYLPLIESLQQKVLLHSEILRHVALGTPCQIEFAAFAPAFCLVNGAYEPAEVAA
ncbi:MAG: hypothetical protein V4712_08345 [Pseudomonadota bacterium]